MQEPTKKNLQDAFAGESQAHMKYLNFASQAEVDGKRNVARLFRAASFSEQIHASEHMRRLGEMADTAQNLVAAAGGEKYEIDTMYPEFIAKAKEQNEKSAETSFSRALAAEKVHHALYTHAKQAVDAGEDVELKEIWVCSHCGNTMEGEPPDHCPVCNAPREMFVEY